MAEQTLGYEKYSLSSYHVFQGAILWLPGEDEISNDTYNASGDRPQRVDPDRWALYRSPGYFHPILVVSRPADQPDMIHFVIMRGFHQNPVESSESKVKAKQYQYYIPVKPSGPHPFCSPQDENRHLTIRHFYEPLVLRYWLENPRKHSYVCVHDVYRMEWKLAQQFYDMNRPNDFQIWGVEDTGALLHLAQQHAGYAPGRQYRQHWMDWLCTMRYLSARYFSRSAPDWILTAVQVFSGLWRSAGNSLAIWDALCWASEPYVRTIWSIVLISTMLAVAECGLWAALFIAEFCKDLLPSLILLTLQELPTWWAVEMD